MIYLAMSMISPEGNDMPPQLKYVSVKDAYNLFKTDACKVKTGVLVHKAIEALLDKPDAMTIYVVDVDNKVVGFIPMMDMIRVTAARFSVRKSGVKAYFQYLSDVMDTNVDDMMRQAITVREDDDLMKALKMMADYNLTDLPVVDKEGHLIGELNGVEMLQYGYDGVKKGDDAYAKLERDAAAKAPKK